MWLSFPTDQKVQCDTKGKICVEGTSRGDMRRGSYGLDSINKVTPITLKIGLKTTLFNFCSGILNKQVTYNHHPTVRDINPKHPEEMCFPPSRWFVGEFQSLYKRPSSIKQFIKISSQMIHRIKRLTLRRWVSDSHSNYTRLIDSGVLRCDVTSSSGFGTSSDGEESKVLGHYHTNS